MRQWQLSCADFTFPLLPHDRALKAIKLIDVNWVDLGIFAGRSHVQPKDLLTDLDGAAKAIFRRLRESGDLRVSDIFLQTGDSPAIAAANSPDIEVRQQNRHAFQAALRLAQLLACNHMTGLPGVVHTGESSADDWNRCVEDATWRVQTARKEGITYSVEPHVGSITSDPVAVKQLVEQVPGLTLTLDYGHFAYAGIPDADVHPLLEFTSHFHARGGAKGRLQTGMSRNSIDYLEIARRLDAMKYRGFVCLEYVWIDWQGCNESDNISETILLKQMLEQGAKS